MKKHFWFIGILIVMGLLSFLGGCSYTAPFRCLDSVSSHWQEDRPEHALHLGRRSCELAAHELG